MSDAHFASNPYRLSRAPRSTHATIARLIGRDNDVLDVGCNEGYLASIADPSNRFWGVEARPQAAEIARRTYRDVVVANLDRYRDIRLDRRFDVIVCADVLEHLLDPVAVLSFFVAQCLAPGGRVVVSLPNIANWRVRAGLMVGRFEYQETGILDRTHLHFYTFRTARDLLAEAGLAVKSVHPGAALLGRAIDILPFTRGLLATGIILEGERCPP
jgi:2-polyprenyl-3-methyl-5-hydroxy-6-metoxy-1,4-benzoquinol methylase